MPRLIWRYAMTDVSKSASFTEATQADHEVDEVPEADFRSRMGRGRTNRHPSHWPADVHEISLEGLSYLGLDSKGRLYLDGDPVYTVKRWGRSERLIALAGVTAAVIGATAALFSAVTDARAAGRLGEGVSRAVPTVHSSNEKSRAAGARTGTRQPVARGGSEQTKGASALP